MQKDIVCGIKIEENFAAGKVRHGRNTYYFCSPTCFGLFLENPHRFLPGDNGVPVSSHGDIKDDRGDHSSKDSKNSEILQ